MSYLLHILMVIEDSDHQQCPRPRTTEMRCGCGCGGYGCGVVVLWCCGVVVLWCCGVVVLWLFVLIKERSALSQRVMECN